MKLTALIAVGVLAGAVVISTGNLFSVGGGDGKPAPVNPYKGMQEREEVYEFTAKPAVKKEGDKWVITFASKGKCDATVAVLDKDGKIVRHLASGVLGVNAPHPFQQNSLSQKLEWDGLTDDFKKAPAGCKVKVSLGLKPEYERNLYPAPYHFMSSKYMSGKPGKRSWLKTATDGQGNTCVAVKNYFLMFGQIYDKDGKYVRTFWPPPAKDVEKVGVKLTTTIWGDKTPWSGWFGPFQAGDRGEGVATLDSMLAASGVAPGKFKDGPWPAHLPKPSKYTDPKLLGKFFSKWSRIVVDPRTKTVFDSLTRLIINEETGEIIERIAMPQAIGPNWAVGVGSFSTPRYRCLVRWPTGKNAKFEGWKPAGRIPWSEGGTWTDERTHLLNGWVNYGNGCNFSGWDVTERGEVVHKILGRYIIEKEVPQAVCEAKGFVGSPGGLRPEACKAIEATGVTITPGHYNRTVQVIDRNGKCLTRRTVHNMNNPASVHMDRDGNLYLSQGGILPVGQKVIHGVADCPKPPRAAWGSIVKFRGRGGQYPLGKMWWNKGKNAKTNPKETPPPDALQVANEVRVMGVLWSYGGLSNMVLSGCECAQATYNQDGWGRLWVPNNAVCGVMVVDPNGNFVMRVGKYGNVDDEGIRFAYIRSVYATDEALYVFDFASARLAKIALSYHAEEELPLP